MSPAELPLTFIIGALIIGLSIGLLLGRAWARRTDPRLRLSEQLRSRDQRLQLYEREVGEHFERTAKLSEELDRALGQLRQHLARGAGKLVDEDLGRRIAGPATGQPVEQPRDYAPSAGLLRGHHPAPPSTPERTAPNTTRPLQLVGDEDDPTTKVG